MSSQDQDVESTISTDDELDTLRAGIDDPMVLKEQLQKEAAARRQLTARAKKAEEERREALTKLAELESKNITSNQQSQVESKPYEINDEVVDLRLDGYSKQEVEWIMKNGGRKTLDDQNSLVSIAIKAQREQAKAEAAASQTTDAGLSEVERKYTPEQMRNMSVKELEAILPSAE